MAAKGVSFNDFYYGDYNARAVERCSDLYLQRVLHYLRKARDWKGLKSLDVGCDDGIFSVELQKLGLETHGIDLRTFIVEKARKRGVKAVVADVQKRFPYKDGTFDLVFAGEIIEHLYDTAFFLQEMRRVTASAGIVIVTTPNLGGLQNRVKLLFNRLPGVELELGPGNAGHIRYYTFPALRKQMERCGLTVVNEMTTNFPFFMMSPFVPFFLKRIAIALGAFFPYFGSQIIAVATPARSRGRHA